MTTSESPEQGQDAAAPIITARAYSLAHDDKPERGAPATRRHLVLPLLLVTFAVITLAVIFVLPRWVAAPLAPADAPAPAPALPAAASPIELPDDPAGRFAAQELLAQTLARITALEARQADAWAKTAMHTLRTQVAEGEKAYREKRYQQAQDSYRGAGAAAARLTDEIPERTAALIDQGKLALANGDSAAANRAFGEAGAMAPDDASARAGLARAATLDRVLALTAQAESYERMQDVDKALAAYREAVALDAEAPGAAAAIARIERGLREEEFKRAMSAGFSALERSDFSAAHAGFTRAARIDRNSPAVKAAQLEVEHAELAAGIVRHLALARRAVDGEQWRAAVAQFDNVLKLDASLSEAIDGRARAAARQRLDAALATHLTHKDRLADEAVYGEANALLAEARAVGGNDRLLGNQIAELGEALRLARVPVTVALRSDGLTQVSLYRSGALGQFTERAVELVPGAYTAVGKRDGYRDVRVEFQVAPAAPGPTVTVQCGEKFDFGN